ncbi:hypothetical protein N7519_005269 [Penicillium mononematosum]|uniref:uncharacterized protein n=1 Tax=Penicillium mononematosum TaxID=268346 RepID=UPI002548699E|nr:uncharacterized protein N7519_005269 [Penicillium mononematosum]KAJ6183968.1 hypothetical protein N7519_005269 [Penicillium mononematosum]
MYAHASTDHNKVHSAIFHTEHLGLRFADSKWAVCMSRENSPPSPASPTDSDYQFAQHVGGLDYFTQQPDLKTPTSTITHKVTTRANTSQETPFDFCFKFYNI